MCSSYRSQSKLNTIESLDDLKKGKKISVLDSYGFCISSSMILELDLTNLCNTHESLMGMRQFPSRSSGQRVFVGVGSAPNRASDTP